jgi:hypothetical protein
VKIVADALSSFSGDKDGCIAPVTIRPCRDILKLYFQDSNKYAGLIAIPTLCKLLDKFIVEFSATLIRSPPKPSPATVKNSKKRLTSYDHSVRIVVYGLRGEESAVSELLSNAGLYLQHPSATECDTDIEYCNPHYLVRPGGQLPALEELRIFSDTRSIKAFEMLNEIEKNRLLRVFDSTDDFVAPAYVIASPRLRSTLKELAAPAPFQKTTDSIQPPAHSSFDDG